MLIVIQLILYCLLFTAMVKYAVRGGAVDGLYFYPKTVQDRAIEIGLITRETMRHKRKVFMTEFYIVMLVALVLIIGLWNRVSDFITAYLQALLFLEVMNWYDGIVIDKIWVGTSKFCLVCLANGQSVGTRARRREGLRDLYAHDGHSGQRGDRHIFPAQTGQRHHGGICIRSGGPAFDDLLYLAERHPDRHRSGQYPLAVF